MWDAARNSSFEMFQAAEKRPKGGGGYIREEYAPGADKQIACMSLELSTGLAWPGTKQSESPRSRKAKASKSRGKLTNAQRCAS